MKVWVTLSQIREVYHTSIEAHRHVLGRLPAVESDSLKDFEKVWSESYTPPPLLEILGIEMSPAEVATSTFEIITTGICVSKPHAAQRVIALKRKQEFAGWVLEDFDDIEDLRVWLLSCNKGFASAQLFRQRQQIPSTNTKCDAEENENTNRTSGRNHTRIILGRSSAIDGSSVAWDNTADGGLPFIMKTYMSIAASNLKKLYKKKEGREERLTRFGCPPQKKSMCVPRIRFAGWDHFRTGLSFVEFDTVEQKELAMHLFFGDTEAQQFCRFHVVSASAPSYHSTAPNDQDNGTNSATLRLSGDTDSMENLLSSIRADIDAGRHGGRPEHNTTGVLKGGSICAPIQKLFGKFGRCEVEFVDYGQMIKKHLQETARLSCEINVDRVSPSTEVNTYIPETLRWSSFAVRKLEQSLESGEEPEMAIQEFVRHQGQSSVAYSGIECTPFFKIRFTSRKEVPETAEINACCALWELQPHLACDWGLTVTHEAGFSNLSPDRPCMDLIRRCGKIPEGVSRCWEPAMDSNPALGWDFDFQDPPSPRESHAE